MRTTSSACVVINDKKEVLLILREDFRIWTMPGGGVEPNETWEQAAVRETLEESGYQVMIDRFVGEYWRPQLSRGEGDLRRVFIGKLISEIPARHDDEALDVRWFPTTDLPKRMNRMVKEQLSDALTFPSSPIYKEQRLSFWMATFVQVALLFRDMRNKILKSNHR